MISSLDKEKVYLAYKCPYTAELQINTAELAECFSAFTNLEISAAVTSKFSALAETQERVHELQLNQSKIDLVHLSACADEWYRGIASIRLAFGARGRAQETVGAAELNLARKQDVYERLQSAKQTRSDKIAQVRVEIDEADRAVLIARKELEDVCEILMGELDRVDEERIGDFVAAVDGYVRAYTASQEEIVNAWEGLK